MLFRSMSGCRGSSCSGQTTFELPAALGPGDPDALASPVALSRAVEEHSDPSDQSPKSEPIRRVALLGVGTLGAIFADRLLDVGLSLTVFDLDERRVSPLGQRGARVATGVGDLVSEADIVLVSLPNPATTQQAVLGPSGVIAECRPGTLIVDTSTIVHGNSLDSVLRRVAGVVP